VLNFFDRAVDARARSMCARIRRGFRPSDVPSCAAAGEDRAALGWRDVIRSSKRSPTSSSIGDGGSSLARSNGGRSGAGRSSPGARLASPGCGASTLSRVLCELFPRAALHAPARSGSVSRVIENRPSSPLRPAPAVRDRRATVTTCRCFRWRSPLRSVELRSGGVDGATASRRAHRRGGGPPPVLLLLSDALCLGPVRRLLRTGGRRCDCACLWWRAALGAGTVAPRA
jgi:hypothetical protein